ncbi:class I SAM-dependent methyltransferase [Curvivirga sp.]|uniref:class I SAM-dependent methyltransferase n=1 Tax=Curvivirga sp. TaxID=2856848 RepID=UPI003B5BC039
MAKKKQTLSGKGAKKATKAIKTQYEDLPYPERRPEDERKRLITGSPGHLVELRHTLFNGKLPQDENGNFRVLIAGGGTGDALVMLAQQLTDENIAADIHYIDLSKASRVIAEKRVKARKLKNITFHTGSLLDAADLGDFHYIDCCGVLHHLPNPQDGFKALAKALKPDGGFGLMVYGTYGRTGVYQMQEALRMVASDGSSYDRVEHTKEILEKLPTTNWLNQNDGINDHEVSDTGIFDLLLHSQDRSYTVPELNQELSNAGLKLVTYIDPAPYNPDFYPLPDQTREVLKEKSLEERAQFCELLSGNMHKHTLYCVPNLREEAITAKPNNMNMIPVYRDSQTEQQFRSMPQGVQPNFTLNRLKFQPTLPPHAALILRTIDGKSSLEDIRRRLPGQPDVFAFQNIFSYVFDVMNSFGKLFLKQR